MPVDLTMHMGLSRRAAMRQRLEIPSLRNQHTLPRSSTPTDNSRPAKSITPPLFFSSISSVSSSSSNGTLKKKKHVVFADDKGLALTDVRLFTEDPPKPLADAIPTPEKPKDQPPVQGRILRFRLGFPQPSADLPSFFGSLADSLVHLESCSLMGGSLSGSVRVCNISLEKAVHIRITFNSWRSHLDVPCTSIPQPPGSDTALFIFTVSFPSDLKLQDHVEFCVSFRPGCSGTLLWDDNSGQNYRILVDVVDPMEVPIRNRSFLTQSPTRLQAWPNRKSQLMHYPACLSPLSSLENMTIKPLNRQGADWLTLKC